MSNAGKTVLTFLYNICQSTGSKHSASERGIVISLITL
jgi:hypothetical protein